MKVTDSIHTLPVFSVKALALTLICVFASSLTMSAAGPEEESESAAAESAVLVPATSSAAVSPVIVTAADLVTKVFGAIDLPEAGEGALTTEETTQEAAKELNVEPEVDETGVWLESEDGYQVNYSGMTPEVSAVAQFDKDSLSSFGYFFIFPYEAGCREEANHEQCEFCSSLLQEMQDMGSIAGMPADSGSTPDSLFTTVGNYDGNDINVKLSEERKPDASGRFLLVLQVIPNVDNSFDDAVALTE